MPPGRGDIVVEFDQDMDPRGYSVCGDPTTLPRFVGSGRFRDERTFVVPVALEPDRPYAFSINCRDHQGFRGVNGAPAEARAAAFRTAAGIAPEAPEERHRRAVEALRRAVAGSASLFARGEVDAAAWDRRIDAFAPALEAARSPGDFARTAAALLAPARDLHVRLLAEHTWIETYRRDVTPNVDLAALRRLVPGLAWRGQKVSTARFPDGIGYLLITSWALLEAAELEPAYALLEGLGEGAGLVIDMRLNAGGDERRARELAGCFVDTNVVYARSVASVAAGEPIDRVLHPSADRPHFRGDVAVLMGPRCTSACESFLLMMRKASRCRLFGARSFGSSGNPTPHDLGNGVVVMLPTWRTLLPDGAPLEAYGVEPDEPVAFASGSDAVLNAALHWLRRVERAAA